MGLDMKNGQPAAGLAGGGRRHIRGGTASHITETQTVHLSVVEFGKRRRGKRADQLIGMGQSLTNT
jgi:hypothetical protein